MTTRSSLRPPGAHLGRHGATAGPGLSLLALFCPGRFHTSTRRGGPGGGTLPGALSSNPHISLRAEATSTQHHASTAGAPSGGRDSGRLPFACAHWIERTAEPEGREGRRQTGSSLGTPARTRPGAGAALLSTHASHVLTWSWHLRLHVSQTDRKLWLLVSPEHCGDPPSAGMRKAVVREGRTGVQPHFPAAQTPGQHCRPCRHGLGSEPRPRQEVPTTAATFQAPATRSLH